MRLRYDKEADAAYLYLDGEISAGGVASTYCCDPDGVDGMINLDFDDQGRLLGLELIPASKYLSQPMIEKAE